MAETKKRQGQKKPDGKKAIPRPLCPKCDVYMQRCYTRGIKNGKRQFIESGWMCPSSTCDYMIKDYIELEDTEDDELTE
jgi:hypothetical protein